MFGYAASGTRLLPSVLYAKPVAGERHRGTPHQGSSELHNLMERGTAILFPVCFLALWFAVSTLVSWLSGWYALMARYPDRDEQPLLCLRRQSGRMRWWCGMNNILTLSVCPGGLRVGMMRVFGPFSRDFFVPWNELAVTRRTIAVWPVAELRFGEPAVGTISLSADLANRLARGSAGRWPEAGPFPAAERGAIFRGLFAQFVVLSALSGVFFTVVPRLTAPPGEGPPVLVAILFPAIFFGVFFLLRYVRQTRHR